MHGPRSEHGRGDKCLNRLVARPEGKKSSRRWKDTVTNILEKWRTNVWNGLRPSGCEVSNKELKPLESRNVGSTLFSDILRQGLWLITCNAFPKIHTYDANT
jgi:hypothetical protein